MAGLTPFKGKREAWEAQSDYHYVGSTLVYDGMGYPRYLSEPESNWKGSR